MGYCMTLEDRSFFIAKENIEPAFKAAKEKLPEKIDTDFYLNVKEGKSLYEIVADFGWDLIFNETGDIESINFFGEKLHDDQKLFEVLAPFIKEDSYIEMMGEDGERWRWVFKYGNCTIQYATIIWD